MKRGFDRKSLVVMALGNLIGSGIFLGCGSVISIAGPGAILAYALGGLIMALEVTYIAEMCIVNPAPGAFRVHASEIFGPWVGFVNGWMFWISGVLGMASEVTAAAVFTRLWLPKVPLWVFCIVYTIIMSIINLNDVRGLSKIEGVLASLKVIALVVFVFLGLFMLFNLFPRHTTIQPAFTSYSNFLPNGIKGLLAPMVMVLFSFTGTGIIGLSLAEAKNPEKDAPSAIRIITTTVIVLYLLSILIIVLLTPWKSVSTSESPFVGVLQASGIPFAATLLNIVVLSAALSGMNSSMYSSSRMLASLSNDRQGPAIFLRKNKNGVPYFALGASSFLLLLTAVLSYILPNNVFILLATASGFTALFNWLTICVTHIFYRKMVLKKKPERLKYKAPAYPYSTIFAIAAIILVLASSPLYPGQVSGLLGSLGLFAILVLFYLGVIKRRKI